MKITVYKLILLSLAFFISLPKLGHADLQGGKHLQELGHLDEKTTKNLKLIFDLLQDKKISVDAGWEFFAAMFPGDNRVKFLTYINILQTVHAGEAIGLTTHRKSLFVEECRKNFNFDLEYLLENFSYPDQGKGEFFSLNAQKLLIELGKPEK
jgi:hypothetical protein